MNYNARISVKLDFNFLNNASDSLHPDDVRKGILQLLSGLSIGDLSNLQGFQQNNINFTVEDITKMPSPEDEIENDLMEFDIF